MRKFFLLMFFSGLLVFYGTHVSAQTTPVSGVVTGENGTPLANVTVTIKGSRISTKTDEAGHYTINAAPGQTLVFSSIGFGTREMKTTGATMNMALVRASQQMEEVVVTAMDIKRNPRELGYSTQTVKGNDIQQTQRENFVNSLQGRVAGLTVTPTTGMAGASAGIVLRGFNTLSGNNQPLFIVDGIIVDNQTLNSNSQSGTGIGLASDGNNRNNDNTNRIADLNPNDIESVTVLKGPEATALYGSQAGSGAIVITTKKAKGTNGKINLTYDNNFRFQKITRFAKTNDDFRPGASNNIPTAPPNTGQFQAFGPRFPEGTPDYDNLHHFYKTGFSQTHSLQAEFGTKNVGFRATGQYFDADGSVPFNTYTKYNFKLANTTKIGKFITITPTISYISAENLRPLKSSVSTSGAGGYLLDLYAWPSNNDVRNYEGPGGQKIPLFNSNINADYDNPIWSAKNNNSYDKLKRWVATLGIDINPFSWLALSGRFGYDTYSDDGYVFNHPQSYMLTSAIKGSLDNYYRNYYGYNHTITATAKKKIGNFDTRLLVGTMWQDFQTNQFAIYGTGLIDSSRRDSGNTTLNTRKRLLKNSFGEPNRVIFRELAYFGEVSIGYKNVAFLSYSHRFEEASPLPSKNRKYNYPGASASVILSDIFPGLKKGNILNYAKLRGSLARTARLNDPYSNQAFLVNNFSSTTLPQSYSYGFTNANPDLEPERQRTYEIGTELRFFNSRLTLDVSYYNTLCQDQIAQGYRASYGTGFILNTQNAASLRNEGLEVTLNLNPVRTSNFDWNVGFNFNHMWSKVLTLPASIDLLKDFYNSDTYISNVRAGLVRGYSTGTITGSKYLRNNAGQILIDPATGLPLSSGTGTNFVIADRTPDFTLGTLNSFRYKNWSLSFLWDLKVGGDIYNGTDQLLTTIGRSERTGDRATPRVINGVLNNNLANTDHPTVNTITIIPQYASAYYTTMPDEEFIQKDVNWFRLRDVTLNYSLPERFLGKRKIVKGLSIFVTGSDLVLFTNYYGADPAVNANNPGTSGVGGYGMDQGSSPTPIGVNFWLKANF